MKIHFPPYRSIRNLFLLICSCAVFQSCSYYSFDKRRYSDGYYFHHSKKNVNASEARAQVYSVSPVQENVQDEKKSRSNLGRIGSNVSCSAPVVKLKSDKKGFAGVLPKSIQLKLKNYFNPKTFHKGDTPEIKSNLGLMSLLGLIGCIIFLSLFGLHVAIAMADLWLMSTITCGIASIIFSIGSVHFEETETLVSKVAGGFVKILLITILVLGIAIGGSFLLG